MEMLKPLILFTGVFVLMSVALFGGHHEADLEFDRATPESVGIDSQAILDFIQGCEDETDSVHSFMIYRHGKLVSDGWWAPHRSDTKHIMHSMSKAFTSTAVGIAIEEGLFSLDDRVISFFPEKAPKNPSENMENLRIRQLLSMSTGHLSATSDTFRGIKDGDWVQVFFEQDPELKPGTYFHYDSGATYMLSAIIQKLTGEKLVDYLKPRLFDKLGIHDVVWEECPRGINVGGWGMFITTEDILRLGILYKQKGVWRGERILSEDWVALATSKQMSSGSSPDSDWDQGYGYKFWQSRHGYRGDGKWGQFCFVLPEQDAVIAVTSGNSDMQKIMNLVWDNLLAGMSDEVLPENEELQAKLLERSKSLDLFLTEGASISPFAKKVSGNKYEFIENSLDSDTLSIKFGKRSDRLKAHAEGLEFDFKIGHDEWIYSEVEWPEVGTGEQKMAARGIWIDDTTYVLKISFYERCLMVTMPVKFESEERLTFDFEFNVDYFKVEYPKLVGLKK